MAQMKQVGSHKTTIYTEGNTTKVKYWSTDVVAFNSKEIILDTGGYRTNTTKTRMNQTSNQFNLGYQVYQKNYDWYVDYEGETHKMTTETITLDR